MRIVGYHFIKAAVKPSNAVYASQRNQKEAVHTRQGILKLFITKLVRQTFPKSQLQMIPVEERL